MQNVSKERQIEEYLNRWGYLNGIKVIQNSYKNDKSKVMFQESLKIEVSNYATKVGEKLLVPLNPFNRVEQIPMKYQDRKLPFHIMRSFKDVDINVFKLPNGIVLDGIPKEYFQKKNIMNTEFFKRK